MAKKIYFNGSAGHNPSGKIACGASDLLDESKENRKVLKWFKYYLRKQGFGIYHCSTASGTSQRNVLERICAKDNKHSVSMTFQIHFNSGRGDKYGDGRNGGFEVWACNYSGKKKKVAESCCTAMKKLGFTNRGLKTSTGLYWLNHTKAPALLFEVCFVDDKDDYKVYKQVGYKKIGKALADAVASQF